MLLSALPLKGVAMNSKQKRKGFLKYINHKKGVLCVYVFLPNCVISEANNKKVDSLSRLFSPAGVRFLGIMPKKRDGDSALQKIIKDYNISFPVIIDSTFVLTDLLGCNVAPSAFVFNNNELIYGGAIDDTYLEIALKKKSAQVNSYLRYVLNKAVEGKNIHYSSTKPIGCVFR